ncbi:MAG: protein-L-isoaspartate(D-aspartate) O-methyltransferase [Deferribacteres bacterium]|nr:protein-L-isoaspartate(D-aspartate) O-methyltransferase [Deferribacteres bacterium]
MFEERRKALVELLRKKGIRDERVLNAILRVPRHLFVPPELVDRAYDDRPLPIGKGQTISQPYIVALMTEALGIDEDSRVLEIGTGSGYQAAVLAEIAKDVYTVERIPELSERARKIIEGLGYKNVFFKVGDGTCGWPEHAPYDAIIVTAASPRIPKPLIKQLKVGGRLVIPVGNELTQELLRITKITEDGKVDIESLGGCVFVKLKGKYGWEE